jgi:hypothetical protein
MDSFYLFFGYLHSCFPCAYQHTFLQLCLSWWLLFKLHHTGRAMAQAASRRPLTMEARVRSQVKSMWDLWWTEWHWDRFFSELSVFPCQFHSTGAPLLVKLGKKKLLIVITGVAQKALRLWCVRSISCGAPSPRKKKKKVAPLWKYVEYVSLRFLCY